MLEQVIFFLEGKHFRGKPFWREKFWCRVFGVANTCYFVMNDVVAINHLPTVVMNIISALG